ncbi:hypothetical protein ACSW9Z_12665 [Clostridium perfringens]|nr:hypothetical protein [Clostridium perfringens]
MKHAWREIGNMVGYSSDYCRKEILSTYFRIIMVLIGEYDSNILYE